MPECLGQLIISGVFSQKLAPNKWFPWAFWWNLFEFFCNGDLPMTFARPRFARREPRWSLASLGRPRRSLARLEASLRFARLEASQNSTTGKKFGQTLRGFVPPHRSVPHGPVPHGHPLVWSFHQGNKRFPWAFWWNLFEFFCNGDLPMTFARPRLASLGGASLRAASLRSVEPRFWPRFARQYNPFFRNVTVGTVSRRAPKSRKNGNHEVYKKRVLVELSF